MNSCSGKMNAANYTIALRVEKLAARNSHVTYRCASADHSIQDFSKVPLKLLPAPPGLSEPGYGVIGPPRVSPGAPPG